MTAQDDAAAHQEQKLATSVSSISCSLLETRRVPDEGKLDKKITPRAMRRTFQDLARAAQVKDIVTRAISGHATESMQRLYSTVHTMEIEEAIGKVVSLAKFKEAMAGKSGSASKGGAHRGAHGRRTKESATQG